jgi:hypothetical protein
MAPRSAAQHRLCQPVATLRSTFEIPEFHVQSAMNLLPNSQVSDASRNARKASCLQDDFATNV